MRKIFVLFLFVASSIFAEQAPAWFTNSEKVFPNKLYIRATGEASTLKNAEKSATTSLTSSFKVKIKTFNIAIQNIELAEEECKNTFSNSQSVKEETEIASDAELFCIHFTDSYFDKREKKYYVMAYIEKAEIESVYKSKIDSLLFDMQKLATDAESESEKLYAVLDLQRAKLLGELAKSYIENAIIVNPKLEEFYKQGLEKIAEISSLVDRQKRKVSFSVSCNDEKQAKSLISGIASILQMDAFVYTKKNADYEIDVDISFREESYEAGNFVRPNVNITISNKNGEAVASYSKSYPRYSYNSLENSYNLAIVRIQQDLEENFLISYRGL